ncbi:unnamed protein product [Parascedosporium putredinis]|uniref:tyrosinase n=1 Tax=Parascedosporium putredinis TaxID=1442378 RepID=A0A9P1H7B8_9PEZI|nr:unnamed protein product [Parascedosporium putredinis]CAI7998374.1 unnamed protein product [Parascedosporium putredinis]
MALVEQQLYSRVQHIASLFPNDLERAVYQDAALTWRMPYWDWALVPSDGSAPFMDEFGWEDITIYGPNGLQDISNPLYSYHFGEREMFDVRSTQFQQRLFMLFTSYNNYATFSSTQYRQEGNETTYESIEGIHDSLHSIIGERGHMDYIMYSAFDPIFFLHHANVDRLVSMWQALNPRSWVTPWPATGSTFTSYEGQILDAGTDLTPFYATTDGQFWNSNLARDTRSFGYVYDDTANVSLMDVSDDAALGTLRSVISRKYGNSVQWLGVERPTPGGIDGDGVDRIAVERFRKAASATGQFIPDLSADARLLHAPQSATLGARDSYVEWIANIRLPRKAVLQPTSLLFFIGDVPYNSKVWKDSPNLVGSFGIFSMPTATSSTSQITGTLPLTAALKKMVAAKFVASMDLEAMGPYLERNLKARVLDVNGRVVDPRSLGLSITVASAFVRPPSKETEFPVWGPLVTRFTLVGPSSPRHPRRRL